MNGILLLAVFVIPHPNEQLYSGNGHVSPHCLAFHPIIWILGRRGFELCHGMELLFPYGYVVHNDLLLALPSFQILPAGLLLRPHPDEHT
jgi:hypothetical protein